jgi:hypothetical protein
MSDWASLGGTDSAQLAGGLRVAHPPDMHVGTPNHGKTQRFNTIQRIITPKNNANSFMTISFFHRVYLVCFRSVANGRMSTASERA